MIEPNNISYRDPVSRVVKKESTYYRYIFSDYKSEYDHLMYSGLYDQLTEKGLLIKHKEIEVDCTDPKVYKQLFPKQLPFQSYPFEWSFYQWRKVILTYLKINHIALNYGMILKDASPYNFCLVGGKAVLFDTSSFAFFNDGDSWLAYRQFCEELLSPFSLMYYNGTGWSALTMAKFSGIPLNFVSKQLSLKSWFNLTTLLHIHMHSKYSYRNVARKDRNTGFSISKLKSLQKMIFSSLLKWRLPYHFRSNWLNYYEHGIENVEYQRDKEFITKKWLEKLHPKSVLDIGANTGKYSFIAAQFSKKVICLESDESCVNEIEKKIEQNYSNVFTLLGNIVEPSPRLGLLNSATEGVDVRFKSEMVLCLALVHHLVIVHKISFSQIADILSNFSINYLVIEFIPSSDSKVRLLINNTSINLKNYTLSNFQSAFSERFEIIEKYKLNKSERVIYLMQKR